MTDLLSSKRRAKMLRDCDAAIQHVDEMGRTTLCSADCPIHARHIANCDPPTIKALLERLGELEAENARLEVIEACHDELPGCGCD